MDYVQIIGFVAAMLTTISNIPQALKIIRTKETSGVSTVTYTILLIGLLLWTTYGICQKDLPVLIANAISALVCGAVLFLKLTTPKVLDEIHNKVHEN